MLVTGESGIGKTTFIKCFQKISKKYTENLINSDKKNKNEFKYKTSSKSEKKHIQNSTIDFENYTINNQEKNFNFNMIDSPGYGGYMDNNCWLNKMINYLISQVNSPLYSSSIFMKLIKKRTTRQKTVEFI